MDREELGFTLLNARRKRGMKLRDVATATGIGIGSLSAIERGGRNVAFDTLRKLLALYGKDISIVEREAGCSTRDAS